MANAKLIIEIITESRDAVAGAQAAQGAMGKFSSGLSAMAGPAAVAGGAIIAIGSDFAKSASDMEQAMGGLDAVFGKSSGQVKAWADKSAESVGLSKQEYAELATVMGAQFKNMGQSTDEAAKSTDEMIRLGADLAATMGGDTKTAVESLSSALKGEGDPAEKYGLSLGAAAINAEMAADGTDKLTGEAKAAARAQAIMAKATKDAGGAVGQFDRELDSASGQSAQASAAFKDMKAGLGEALLPVLKMVMSALAGVARWVSENKTAVLALMGVIGGFAAAILAANAALKVYAAGQTIVKVATAAWSAAQWLLNAAMTANPVGLVIAAVALLAAGIVVLWKKSETFRNIVTGVWRAVKAAAVAAWNAIKTAVSSVISFISGLIRGAGGIIRGVFSAVKAAGAAAFNAIKTVVSGVIDWIKRAWNTFMTAITTIWNGLKSIATTAWNAVKAPVETVIEWVKTQWDKFMTAIEKIWNGLKALAKTAWDAVKEPVETVVEWVTTTWEGLVDTVGIIWDKITAAVKTALQPIEWAINGIKTLWDTVYGGISRAIETVKGWISDVSSKLSDLLDKTGDSGFGLTVGGMSAGPSSVVYQPVSASRVPGVSAGALGGPTRTTGGMGAGGVTINVSGALDADAVARQINAMLTNRRRRVGPVLLGGALT